MPPERRVHRRYAPVETAYAALGAEFSRVGKIRDFSAGGLSFNYLVGKGRKGGIVTIDIFLVDDSFHIHNLPCKIVYDVPLNGKDSENLLLRSRRCAVSFAPPTLAHNLQIATFIRLHTISDQTEGCPETSGSSPQGNRPIEVLRTTGRRMRERLRESETSERATNVIKRVPRRI